MTERVKQPRRRKGRRTFGNVWKLPSGRYRASYVAPDGQRPRRARHVRHGRRRRCMAVHDVIRDRQGRLAAT